MSLDERDFYATLIHDLKNDLGLLSMTIDGIPASGDAAHDEAVDAARLLCEQSVTRLRQTLLIYKAAQQSFHPRIDAHSPHELMQAVAARAASLAHARLSVTLDIAADVPAVWFFDRDLLDMALMNAVQNSLRHARSAIRLMLALENGALALGVDDDSAGYPDAVLSAVAAGAPCPAAGPGTGLGLRFARLIAQCHDHAGRTGTLSVRNDGGAVFRLLIP